MVNNNELREDLEKLMIDSFHVSLRMQIRNVHTALCLYDCEKHRCKKLKESFNCSFFFVLKDMKKKRVKNFPNKIINFWFLFDFSKLLPNSKVLNHKAFNFFLNFS